jgi:hypothetical protein
MLTLHALLALQFPGINAVNIFQPYSRIKRTTSLDEIERDLIRMRVNEGVKAAHEKSVKTGRPKGVGKSRLDQHKMEIMHCPI